ncbi:hypothetical protein AB833_07755 [Chromatiales bacterium (ex Bugula neritina AB1)]|nr:hypothetical protein AB833_07755 [Chromatiales bacterium (ex Bugula neritina AB1)]
MSKSVERSLDSISTRDWDLSEIDYIGAEKDLEIKRPAISRIDLPSCSEAARSSTHLKRRWVPTICVICVAGLFAWASLAKIDQVTRGHGKVIPGSKVQIIQSLVDGIIADIPVTEGQIVEKGQEVLRFDNTLASARYTETLARHDLVTARMSRLLAEADDFTQPVYPENLSAQAIHTETELFQARRDDYLAKKDAIEKLLLHAKDELEILRRGENSITKLDILRAQRDVATLRGDLNTLISETRRNALEEHDRHRAELASLESALTQEQDNLQRTVLRSPLRGTVNKIYIAGSGGVVRGSENIMEIVPINDTLLIEANMRPEDIGFIHSNQVAMVKFTAYEYTIYGGIEGIVEYIGVDTVNNDQGDTYYPIRIRTNTTTIGSSGEQTLSIIPGMVAEVDILSGQKSVLQYLLTPLNRVRAKALTEQ